MRRAAMILALVIGALTAATDGTAQDRTFALTGLLLNGAEQRWFSGGAGNELPEAEIEKYWNEGKYITAAAYTADGWMICMMKDNDFLEQAYIYDEELSMKLIKQCYDKGYVITSISRGPTKFLVVLSEHLMYDDQTIKRGKWADMQTWYNSKYNEGYRTTAAAYSDGEWILVMTKDSPYKTQQFMMVDEAKRTEAVNKIWNEGQHVHLAEYGGGKFLVFYGEDREQYGQKKQACKQVPENFSTWLKGRWDEGMYIRYIGGGNATAKAPQKATASTYTPTYTPTTTYMPTATYSPTTSYGGTSGGSRANTAPPSSLRTILNPSRTNARRTMSSLTSGISRSGFVMRVIIV